MKFLVVYKSELNFKILTNNEFNVYKVYKFICIYMKNFMLILTKIYLKT